MNKELALSYDLLKKVYLQSAYSSIELNKLLETNSSKQINFALITKITYGVLQKDIYLDYVVNNFVKKPCAPSIMVLLKLGAYVHEFVDSIPPYALINECVELSKKESKFASGFVNATLKNIVNTKVNLPSKTNKAKYYSVKYSHPMWLVEYMLKNFGEEFTNKLLDCELTTLTHVRVLDDINTFKEMLDFHQINYQTTPLNFTLYVDYQKLIKVAELKDKYVVQGLPSVIVGLNVKPSKNQLILDATGAPGGKSALIAQTCPECKITCCDIHPHRVGLIKNLIKSHNITNVSAVMQDATKLNSGWLNLFDCVLCDVPCSGLGVVNKKPDILLNKTMSDVNTLKGVQLSILTNNSNYVKVGGCLIYSTCTIMREENEQVIQTFLKAHPNFKLAPIDTFGITANVNNNMTTFYPHISGTEGFFITKLTKIS